MWFRFSRPDYWYFGRYTLTDAGDASPFNRGWSQGFGFFVLNCRWNEGRSESEGIHYQTRPHHWVTVNGLELAIHSETVSYELIRSFAGQRGYPSMTFHKADQDPADGTMWQNCRPVRVKDGTVFNVCHTGNA